MFSIRFNRSMVAAVAVASLVVPGQLLAAESADNAAQVLQTTITYDEEVPPATHRSRSRRPPGAPGRAMVLRRTVVTLPLRFFYRFEVEWLLLAAGFALETVFGSYDLETYAAGSPRLIWLARTEA